MAAGMAGRPPMDPRRRQIWQVAPGLPIPREIPFVIDVDRRFYIRRYRELLLLSLMDEEPAILASNEPAFDWNQIYEITDRVEGRIPALAEASVAKGWAGWRTLTPDFCRMRFDYRSIFLISSLESTSSKRVLI